jgi:hypothetical protein
MIFDFKITVYTHICSIGIQSYSQVTDSTKDSSYLQPRWN